MKLNKQFFLSIALAAGVLAIGSGALLGCGDKGATTEGGSTNGTSAPTGGTAKLSGPITIDGSSTVYPISQAIAEEFMKANPDVKATANFVGTGGGMKKFVAGEIDICGASRPIEQEEIDKAKENGIEFVEIPVAFDGLSIVVNKENNFVESLTVDELKKMWAPEAEGKITNWNQVRAGFPDQKLELFGPGQDSGTFEYFTEAIVKKKKASRSDYQPSEDDNQIVTGVAGEKGGLGYFGYAYYLENQDSLKLLKVDGGKGPIEPSEATINDGTYSPLSRPIFIYVSKAALEKPQVKEYIKFYLSSKGQELVKETGYVALPAAAYTAGQKFADEMKFGTRFKGVEPGMKIEDVIAREGA